MVIQVSKACLQSGEETRLPVHSSNIIERMNKETRRGIKVIDALPNESSALKIIYLRVAELNERWSNRAIKGYYKCKEQITNMFRGKVSSMLHIIPDSISYKT